MRRCFIYQFITFDRNIKTQGLPSKIMSKPKKSY